MVKIYGGQIVLINHRHTYEKRIQSFKHEIHQLHNQAFENTPVSNIKMIVSIYDRRNARSDLICKQLKRSLLYNKPIQE